MSADTEEYLFGMHSVLAALRNAPAHVDAVWLDENRHDHRAAQIMEAARAARVRVHQVPRAKLDQLSGGVRHQGVVARSRPEPVRGERELTAFLAGLQATPFLLVLDGVQDPHNLGACLRTADAAGVQAVIIPRDQAVSVTGAVRRVASGAAEAVPVFQVTNLARALKELQEQGIWLVGAAGEGERELFETDLTGPLALVLGGEEGGLRRLTRELCDRLVRIPMLGRVESLNVSVAAGICVYEAVRQRRAHGSPGP